MKNNKLILIGTGLLIGYLIAQQNQQQAPVNTGVLPTPAQAATPTLGGYRSRKPKVA